jgi:outer membrane protein insertion porin family
MPWILIVLLLLPPGGAAQRGPARKSSPAKAQAPPAEPDKWPIASLAVEGNRSYPAGVILAAAGLRVGQLAGKEEFDAARDRLVATGVFETVGYRFAPSADGKGFAAAFQVTEVEPMYPVRFERLNANSEELTALLKRKDPFFGAKIAATDKIVERHARAIEEYLASRNQREKVIGKVVADNKGDLAIVFRPAAPLPVIAQVKFEGNQVIPSQLLLNTFSGVAFGATYTEENVRQLLNTSLRPLYDARGRVAVSFPKVTAEKAKDVDGVIVTVSIDEGASYNLGNVQVAGASGLNPKQVLKTGNIKTGDIANFDDVAAGVERMKRFYRREGYMRVDAGVERKINDKPKTVDVTVRIEEGPQFLFRKLTIEGLDMHGEAGVRKLWAMKEGKPFNADYPEYFLNRIREDGVFDGLGKTRSRFQVDEQARMVDVTLTFGAAPPPEDKKRRVPY